ncbi:MAG: alpha/beta hydrolase [Rubrobacteraceae bacterium]
MLRIAVVLAALIPVLLVAYFGVGLLVASRLTAAEEVRMEQTPAALGLDFQDVRLESTDGLRLASWWVPKEGSSEAAILVHGLGGNKSGGPTLTTAQIYNRAGYNVLMLDLRAHGESEGSRRTLGHKEVRDVRGALDWLRKRGIQPEQTILHGWSMGGATVVRSAPGTGVAAVVEEAGYADLPLLLGNALPKTIGLPAFFSPGAMLMAKVFLGFDPWEVSPKSEAGRLSSEGTPLYIIHSTTDQTVPFRHAEIFAGSYPGARLWKLEGYGHVEAYSHPEYEERLSGFLEGLEVREAA